MRNSGYGLVLHSRQIYRENISGMETRTVGYTRENRLNKARGVKCPRHLGKSIEEQEFARLANHNFTTFAANSQTEGATTLINDLNTQHFSIMHLLSAELWFAPESLFQLSTTLICRKHSFRQSSCTSGKALASRLSPRKN
ncbi:hypothetical protein Mapa_013773 [Marchantia paleacea]|nr:hypothetical protein Mapa_013773 [Marchantia paleacea]